MKFERKKRCHRRMALRRPLLLKRPPPHSTTTGTSRRGGPPWRVYLRRPVGRRLHGQMVRATRGRLSKKSPAVLRSQVQVAAQQVSGHFFRFPLACKVQLAYCRAGDRPTVKQCKSRLHLAFFQTPDVAYPEVPRSKVLETLHGRWAARERRRLQRTPTPPLPLPCLPRQVRLPPAPPPPKSYSSA